MKRFFKPASNSVCPAAVGELGHAPDAPLEAVRRDLVGDAQDVALDERWVVYPGTLSLDDRITCGPLHDCLAPR